MIVGPKKPTRILPLLTLAATMILSSFLPVYVYADDDRAECRHRIERVEAKFRSAVRRHGEHSAQADARRAELKAQRERCYNRIREWWDGHEHKWHKDRDWD